MLTAGIFGTKGADYCGLGALLTALTAKVPYILPQPIGFSGFGSLAGGSFGPPEAHPE
jgi:hypothetical protein